MTVRLEGAPVAAAVDTETRTAIAGRVAGSRVPALVSLHRGVDSPFRVYLRRQVRAAQALGIQFREEAPPSGSGPDAFLDRARGLAADPNVDAVLMEHPLPPPYDFLAAASVLRPAQDVDGVSPPSLGRLVSGHPVHVPAVARAAVRIAQHYRLPIGGARVAVIGRSPTVGLPLALLLGARSPGPDATVTVVHSRTPDLRDALAGSRVIFSCAGHPGLLNREVVPQGAAIVDVGLSAVPDPSKPSGLRSVGDADPVSLDGWADSLTPVPGGVGPVTVAELMRSATRAWELQRSTGTAER